MTADVGAAAGGRGRRALRDGRAARAPRRRADGAEGRPLHAGRPDDLRARRSSSGFVPPYDATAVARLRAGRRGAARQAQHGRVRDGLVHRALGLLHPTRNPWDLTRVPGGSSGGSAAAVAGGSGAGRARHRHRRLDPSARGVLRRRRPQADLWPRVALRRWSPSPPRSTRSARSRATCDDCRARPRGDRRPRSARLDVRRRAGAGLRARSSGQRRRGATRRRARGVLHRRARPRGRGRGARGDQRAREARRADRAGLAAAHRVRARRLLPDRAGRGLVEPGALRRREVRAARARRRATSSRCTARRARRASAQR